MSRLRAPAGAFALGLLALGVAVLGWLAADFAAAAFRAGALDATLFLLGQAFGLLVAPAVLAFAWAAILDYPLPSRRRVHRTIAILVTVALLLRFVVVADALFTPTGAAASAAPTALDTVTLVSAIGSVLVLAFTATVVVRLLVQSAAIPTFSKVLVSLLLGLVAAVMVAAFTLSPLSTVAGAAATVLVLLFAPRRTWDPSA